MKSSNVGRLAMLRAERADWISQRNLVEARIRSFEVIAASARKPELVQDARTRIAAQQAALLKLDTKLSELDAEIRALATERGSQ